MCLFNEPALFLTSFSLYPPLLLTNGQCRRYRSLMGELQVCSALLGKWMVPLGLRGGMVLLARNGHWDAIGHCVSFDCCVLAAVSDAYNCAHKGVIINYIIFKGISPLICCCLWLLFLCPPPVLFCPTSLPVSPFQPRREDGNLPAVFSTDKNVTTEHTERHFEALRGTAQEQNLYLEVASTSWSTCTWGYVVRTCTWRYSVLLGVLVLEGA